MARKICSIVVAIAVALLGLTSCSSYFEDLFYHAGAKWRYTSAEFEDEYIPYFENILNNLRLKYGIDDCKEKNIITHTDYGEYFKEYLFYTNEYTIDIFIAGRSTMGSLRLHLYYCGNEEKPIEVYENQEHLVNFINELVRTVGYDTRLEESENHFLRLYNKSIETGTGGAENYQLHGDSIEDTDGGYCYAVWLDTTKMGYLHEAEDHSGSGIPANVYWFYGILKGN